jgi:hypothetical protein
MVDTYFAEHGTDKPYLLVNYTTGGTTTTTTTTGTTTTSAPGSFSVTTLGSDAHNIIAGQLNGLGAGTTTVHFNWGYSSTDLEYSTPLFQKI